MADGQWGTLTFEVPDFLADARDSINSVAEFLVTALDIALIALKLAKAFLIGLIDPIASLVQSLVNEIEGLLKDLQQLGIYITGDWKLLKWPFEDLQGGFSEYERRMIARLTDQSDPTRPDLPQTLSVLSIFFYLSVDISDIQRLVAFLIELVKFFNQSYNPPGGMPVPVISGVKYGTDAISILQPMNIPDYFKMNPNGAPPNVAQVKWKVPAPVQKNPMNPFPPLPPGGFLVTVSTFPEGIKVVYDRALGNTGKVEGNNGKVQPRDFGTVRDSMGRSIVLHGGADSFSLPKGLGYNQAVQSGKLKDGYNRIYGTLPNGTNIPLDLLTSSSGGATRPFFQKTFLVPLAAVATQWATSEYMITLNADEMPVTGKIVVDSDGTITIKDEQETSTFYVRVASTTTDIGNGAKQYRYDFGGQAEMQLASPPTPVSATMLTGSVSDASLFSQYQTITFPGTFTQQYLEAVQVALVVLFLSRPDLVPIDQLEPFMTPEQKAGVKNKKVLLNRVALERCGLEKVQQLTGYLYKDYQAFVEKRNVPIAKGFRKDLLRQVQRVAQEIYAKTGPNPAAEEAIVKQTQYLRTVTWGDIFRAAGHTDIVPYLPEVFSGSTILDSLSDPDFLNGLGLNPFSIGLSEEKAMLLFTRPGVIRDRDPQMMEVAVGADDPSWTPVLSVNKAEAKDFLKNLSPALLPNYEKWVQEDGSIQVPGGMTETVLAWEKSPPTEGSADLSPVAYVNLPNLVDPVPGAQAGVYYCRGLFAKANDGQILQEAAITLSLAGAALRRSPDDGEWIAIRFFDQFPSWQEFLQQLVNWVKSVQNSLQSVVDTILKYIEFVEARIVEIQQLIQRINALLQGMLGNVFRIPKCSALFLVSNGTAGILSDLVTAENKPNDSPLAYGAGLAVVIPFGPAFVMDIIRATFVQEDGSPPFTGEMGAASISPPAVGIEGLPAPVPPPDTGPDVL